MGHNIAFLGKCKFITGAERMLLRKMLFTLALEHRFEIDELTYVYVSDDELLEMNQRVLNHDTYTDIITFDLSDSEGRIDGEIYISKDRITENAQIFNQTLERENIRVVAHGILHLMGYRDKSESEIQEMRKQEDNAIELYLKLKETLNK